MDAGGPWTGASINPARIFAGLIVYGCNLHGVWWIYLLSQVVGAFLGAGVRSFFKIARRMLMPEPSSRVDCCSGCLLSSASDCLFLQVCLYWSISCQMRHHNFGGWKNTGYGKREEELHLLSPACKQNQPPCLQGGGLHLWLWQLYWR